MTQGIGRRAALAAVATGLVGSVGGCSWGPSFSDADVVAGPEGRLVFEPKDLTVPVGESVTWEFASNGHNVSGRPDHSDVVELPDNAEPFASYGQNESPIGSHISKGETYEHVFALPGQYVYVCVPHIDRGMVGTIRVE